MDGHSTWHVSDVAAKRFLMFGTLIQTMHADCESSSFAAADSLKAATAAELQTISASTR